MKRRQLLASALALVGCRPEPEALDVVPADLEKPRPLGTPGEMIVEVNPEWDYAPLEVAYFTYVPKGTPLPPPRMPAKFRLDGTPVPPYRIRRS